MFNRFLVHHFRTSILLVAPVTLLLLSSCNLTRNVPEKQYLLDKTKVTIDNKKQKNIKVSDIDGYIRQKTNKKIVMTRFHLRVYNSARNRIPRLSRWLRTIGEEPVILDTTLTSLSAKNIKWYLDSKGYFSSRVTDSTYFSQNKKAKTYYKINLGEPHRLRNINYVVEDSVVRGIVMHDTLNSILKKGTPFDMSILEGERKRIESTMKEKGYFFFSNDYVTFDADTSVGQKQVDIILRIRNRFSRNDFGERMVQEYKKYEISNVFILPNFDPIKQYNLQMAKLLDTIYTNEEIFVFSNDPGIKLQVLSQANLIKPGSIYSESLVQKTHNNLSSLRLFRMVNIYFEVDESDKDGLPVEESFIFFSDDASLKKNKIGKLNCFIQLTPHTLQSYQTELVGTNSSSDFGFESNLSYQHKNLFKGAEVFDTKLRGSLGLQKKSNKVNFKQQVELGVSTGISFPRFLSPFSGKEFLTKYSPQTHFSASYNFSDRPNYTRTIAGLNFSYNWKDAKYLTHTISPAEISMINIFAIDTAFFKRISNTYLANSYKDQLVTTTSYSLIFNNQVPKKNTSFTVIRFNFETSGNILNALNTALNRTPIDGAYQVIGISYSQFVRGDINAVYNHIVDRNNTFVYRIYAGIGFPYGNSKALPFEKKYFSGGSSGVRAWSARSLGPGTYYEKAIEYADQSADIKFEANLEYRFKVFETLEGAFFVDAGNIWAISAADERPGALFKVDQFYKQIALGTGVGVRLNLGFFIFRLDTGIKVYDPAIRITQPVNPGDPVVIDKDHWIPFDRPYSLRDDFTVHLGIGYPF
jgi:outer membrane protein assembly factor BamA